jgi:hypothetical protein
MIDWSDLAQDREEWHAAAESKKKIKCGKFIDYLGTY